MTAALSSQRCCIPSCTGTPDLRCSDPDAPLCTGHFEQASEKARARSVETRRRLEWLAARWHDDSYFDAVEKSGRYLKFASAMAQATDAAHFAWQRVRVEATVAELLAVTNGQKAAPQERRGTAA